MRQLFHHRRNHRPGVARGWLLAYVVLAFVGYLTFVHPTPPIQTVLAQSRSGSSPRPQIRLVQDASNVARFEVHGLSPAQLKQWASHPEQQSAAFTVAVVLQDVIEGAPMLGTCRLEQDVVIFEPRFRLAPGVTYLAQMRSVARERFSIPNPPPAEPTAVESVFPSSSELPENQLKFYVFFSAPMSRGYAYRNIRLLKEDGQVVDGAFLEIAEELWDRDVRRFTLLLDPGRVKRGLKPREEDGPVLEEGKRYTLVIDSAWLDAGGFELKEPIRKSITVLPPDDVPPDTANWKIDAPSRENDYTLSVEFPEPLDRALLERVVWVEASGGDRMEGRVEIDRQETRWRFRPAEPWDEEQSYSLAVERILEDRAGNRIGRKFEVDVFEKIDRRIETDIVRLPLRMQP